MHSNAKCIVRFNALINNVVYSTVLIKKKENMKVYSRIYLVEDGFGQRTSASCEEGCDTIQICGLRNSGEEKQYFESDAYHLEEWCRVNGFKYKCIEKEYDFDQLWNE
tara:strand:- start:1285 stop:1608 length:324 start_codon:yes stop_codon:yes gene_type:complete